MPFQKFDDDSVTARAKAAAMRALEAAAGPVIDLGPPDDVGNDDAGAAPGQHLESLTLSDSYNEDDDLDAVTVEESAGQLRLQVCDSGEGRTYVFLTADEADALAEILKRRADRLRLFATKIRY